MDENGLGPALGPMVVTAVAARVTERGASVLAKGPSRALAGRLGDSKALVAHGDVALGEAWARALAERLGAAADSPDALVHALSLEPREALRAPCPSGVERQCWGAEGEAFVAEPAAVSRAARDLAALVRRGVEVVGVQTIVVCTRRLNEAAARGEHRFLVDLHAMERLYLHFAERFPGEAAGGARAVCGKVGGLMRYEGAFGPLGGRLFTCLAEGPAESRYHFPGLGELAFLRDAESADLLVALASLVGKWVREALMARIPRFYEGLRAGRGKALESVSGYHDPRTLAFMKATRRLRVSAAVPDDCFVRAKR